MDIHQQAQKLVEQMTLEEKASLCSGEDFWHLKTIPRLGLTDSLLLTDGPHGLRKQTEGADQLGINDSLPATCFPAECATACSFDRELLSEIGAAIGDECRSEDVSVLLGPGVNIKRSPLCGRNFEYFSEDPLVSGELAAAFIDGVQSKDVGCSLKHYAANNQETRRMTADSVVDERALNEIYLPAFETAVKKAQPWTVMCSYNRLDGEYASENRRLITEILRDRWGFNGLVVSDWGAVNDRVAGIHAGLNVEMPAVSRENDRLVEEAVRAGKLSADELDTAACRVVELMLKSSARSKAERSADLHHALARRAAASSAVLLKNEDKLLPLTPDKKLAVIGAFAEKPRYQGAGSSKINPNRLDSALSELTDAGVTYEYSAGYDPAADAPDEALIAAACKTAEGKDAVVIFAGLPDRYESEGFDRSRLDMPEAQNELIRRVSAVNHNTIVVLMCGSVVLLPWENDVKAILLAYLGGESVCGAVADLLLGKQNPSGKLAETWGITLEDNPSHRWFPGESRTVEYRESVFVGYRYYDTAGKAVRYPFGYGLSYTPFAYSDLHPDKLSMGDDEELTVSFSLTNIGDRAGSETAQLYVAPKIANGIFRPEQELRGFEKVHLQPRETKRVSIKLGRRAFAYYNVNTGDWTVESGEYELRVCSSSRDVELMASVTVTAVEPIAAPDYREVAPCYYDLASGLGEVPDAAFAALLGRELPPSRMQAGEAYTVNSTMREIQNKWLGRVLASVVTKAAVKMMSGSEDMRLMAEKMLMDSPLRMMLMSGGDMMSVRRLNGLVDMLNGKTFSGLGKLLKR